nr:hypothetical protein [Kordiimonas pumila]
MKRYQYTAIDDATRVRALKVYTRHTQKSAIDFVNHIIQKFPFRIQEIRTDRGHVREADVYVNFRPNSITAGRKTLWKPVRSVWPGIQNGKLIAMK